MFLDLMDEVRHSWAHPFQNSVSIQSSTQFMAILDKDELELARIPPVKDMVPSSLSPSPEARQCKATLPSQPCRFIAGLMEKT